MYFFNHLKELYVDRGRATFFNACGGNASTKVRIWISPKGDNWSHQWCCEYTLGNQVSVISPLKHKYPEVRHEQVSTACSMYCYRLCEWCSPHCWPYHFLIYFSITLFPLVHSQFLDPPSPLVFWPSPFTTPTRSQFLSGQTLWMGNTTWASARSELHIPGSKNECTRWTAQIML